MPIGYPFDGQYDGIRNRLGMGMKDVGGFLPTDLAGLELWLDADDAGTITDSGGLVSQWDDKSGEGHNATQGTGAEQPITGANTIGGKNVIAFDDTDDRLEIATNAGLAGFWATGGTILAVYRSALVTGFGRLMSSGAEWGLFKASAGTTFGLIVDFTATNADFRSDNQYSPNTSEIIAITYDGSSDANEPVWRLNGSIIPPDTTLQPVGTYVAADGSMGIGNETFANNNPFDGDIAEIIIYNRIITPSESFQLHTYLSDKWTLPFFSPIQIPGLELWLDAADTATITDSGGAVSQWDDKSGNGFDVTQGTGASQPATGVNTINGLNAIEFDGVDDVLNNTSFTDFSTATIFAVAVYDPGSDGNQALVDVNNGATNTGMMLYYENVGTKVRAADPGLKNIIFNESPPIVPHIFTGTASLTVLEYHIDGDSKGTIGLGGFGLANTLNRVDIGQLSGLILFTLEGRIGEVLIFNRDLLDAEREAVEAYLSQKWGVVLDFPLAFSSDFSSDFS